MINSCAVQEWGKTQGKVKRFSTSTFFYFPIHRDSYGEGEFKMTNATDYRLV